jgi:protoporphyrinogen oxidase
MKNIVINGTGISGLLYALLMVESGYKGSITMVDKASEPGGLLRRWNYGEYGNFDYGMHNFLETGIAELDALVFGLLPENEWDLLEGPRRDLCGSYYLDTLQSKTPYIDIRNLPEHDYQECLADFLAHISTPLAPINTQVSAHDFFCTRFGKKTAERLLCPAIEKIHKHPATELDYMATIFTPLSRITLGNEYISAQLTESEYLRNFIAWGDQRTLPLERSSGRRAYYPKHYGMYRVVDAMIARLKKAGVTLLLGSSIMGIQHTGNQVTAVDIQHADGSKASHSTDHLVWTNASPLLAKMLNIPTSDLGYDKPLRTAVVNLLLSQPLEAMGDLYYFFCYEPGFHTYRLTNFANYCSGAARGGLYPISMELLVEDNVAQSNDLASIAQEELARFNLLHAGNNVAFAKAELLDAGFPMPTIKNITATRTIRNRIDALHLANLDLIGILAQDNLFFQTDVMRYVHQKVRARC